MTTPLIDHILDLSRQNSLGPLSPWFADQIQKRVQTGFYAEPDVLRKDLDGLVERLRNYSTTSGRSTVVIGISGGVDSALTAALFRDAGWRVRGFTLPIEQNPEETARGVEACAQLGIDHTQIDLTPQYRSMVNGLAALDPDMGADDAQTRIRRGNMRARLRMITLYDQAHRFGGVVGSTDNLSELSAGFWTLNGDVGDVAPVQALLKSWEVPWMAREIGVPESVWRATPTDGLGISAGDEAQLGATYLQWDLMILAMAESAETEKGFTELQAGFASDPDAQSVFEQVSNRMRRTAFKRRGTLRLDHPRQARYAALDRVDALLAG
ncbi:MAG: NAD(+) synthase [Rhodobacteraceae bacterium]|nr:NAD(+) synthase [Paracoccaceae bacterium]